MHNLKIAGVALWYVALLCGISGPCYGQGQASARSEAYHAEISTRVYPSEGYDKAVKESGEDQSSIPSYMRPPPPRDIYIKVPRRPGIELSTAVMSAIHKFDPGFEIWNSTEYPPVLEVFRQFTFSASSDSTLSVGIGDFNGDGSRDALVAGHDAECEMVLVLISSRNAEGPFYDVMPICATNDESYQKKYHSGMHAYCGGITNGSSPKDFIGKPQMFIRRIIKKGTCLTHDECEGDCTKYCLKADAFETYGINYPENASDSAKIPGLGPRDLFRWDFEPSKYDPYDFVRYGIY